MIESKHFYYPKLRLYNSVLISFYDVGEHDTPWFSVNSPYSYHYCGNVATLELLIRDVFDPVIARMSVSSPLASIDMYIDKRGDEINIRALAKCIKGFVTPFEIQGIAKEKP